MELEDASAAGDPASGPPSTFGRGFCVTTSMADAVVAHLVSRVLPGRRRGLPRHRLALRRDLGTRDAVDAVMDVNVITLTPRQTRRRAGRRVRRRAVRPRPRRVLRAAQGRAAGGGPDRVRRLGHRPAPRRVADPRRTRRSSAGTRSARKVKVNPIARWTQADVDALHRRARRPDQPAAQGGLRLDRLRAVHPAGAGRRGPARRPLGRPPRPSAGCTTDDD